MYKMDGYSLSRRWYDWVFRNPGSVSPAHGALYHWYIEACNRAEWPDVFDMAPQYAMSATGIHAYNTYKNYLSDLQAWGFVRIRQIGSNQYVPWILALSNIDEPLNKANQRASSNIDIPLNKARNKANTSASSNFDKPLNEALNEALDTPVDKARSPITINNKPINPKPKTSKQKANSADADAPVLGGDEVEFFETEEVGSSDSPKKPVVPNEAPGAAKVQTVVSGIKALITALNPAYYWTAKDGGAARDLALKMRNAIEKNNGVPCSDKSVIDGIQKMIERTGELEPFYHFKDLAKLNGDFNGIITQLQSTRQKRDKNGNPARQSDAEFASSIDQLVAMRYGRNGTQPEERASAYDFSAATAGGID